MNDWSDSFYLFIYGAVLLLSVLGLWFTAIMPGSDRWSKRFFRCYFLILMLSMLSGVTEGILHIFFNESSIVFYCVLILESLFPSLPFVMLTAYLLHCCRESIRGSRLFYAVLTLWAFYFAMLTTGPFIGAFTVFMPDGHYSRGYLYPLLVLPLVAIMLLNLYGTVRRRKRLSRKAFFSFIVGILPITVTLVIHIFVDIFPLIHVSIVLSALSMYGLILTDQVEQDLLNQQKIAQQQQELINQRARIMVLQMRPHFIYNTLMSIYSLCRQDPEKARQIVLDFTNYLRKNFNAVVSENPIPFSAELEHTRAYLAVEQAQYEDLLIVDYDVPHIRFRVPPLVIQPIVENAVKHGMNPYGGPLHISVRTRKTDSGSEIVVADDGCGFEHAYDSEQGITLKNIQQRLKTMCGGNMTIVPNDGGGTVVTVTIPDSAAAEDSAPPERLPREGIGL